MASVSVSGPIPPETLYPYATALAVQQVIDSGAVITEARVRAMRRMLAWAAFSSTGRAIVIVSHEHFLFVRVPNPRMLFLG